MTLVELFAQLTEIAKAVDPKAVDAMRARQDSLEASLVTLQGQVRDVVAESARTVETLSGTAGEVGALKELFDKLTGLVNSVAAAQVEVTEEVPPVEATKAEEPAK